MPQPLFLAALLLGLCAAAVRADTPPAPLAAEGCLGCHGPDGRGAGAIVALAGRDAAELRAAMTAFRANERPATIMGRVARGYTDAEIERIAAYFAALPR